MIEVIFAAHGQSAPAMADSVAMVLGAGQRLHTLALTHDEGIAHFRRQLTSLVATLRQGANDGILILTDMPAGTPYNVGVELALAHENMDVLSGANFPMVLTALDQNELPLAELAALVMATGRESIHGFVDVEFPQEDF